MGLQHGSYAIGAGPDWEEVRRTLQASMGVRVRLVRDRDDTVSLRAWRVGGSAHCVYAHGRLEWEAPLSVNAYFLAHLHAAFLGVGANPDDSSASTREGAGVLWRALPLRRRLAYGIVGQVALGLFGLLLLPFLFMGFVLVNLFLLVRGAFRRLLRRR